MNTSNKPRMAICLTGLARGWKRSYPLFKQYMIDRYDVDVFINIRSEVGWYTGRKAYLPESPGGFVNVAATDRGFHDSGEIVDVKDMIETYNPVTVRVENFDNYCELFKEEAKNFPKAYTRPAGTIAQSWMAHRGFELVQDHVGLRQAKYDIVVRARPDVTFEQDPGIWDLNTVYTLPSRNRINQGTGDSVQIGSYAQIETLANMYFHIPELYGVLGVSCPHMYMAQWIRENRLPWKEMPIGAHVEHSQSGIVYAEPEEAK